MTHINVARQNKSSLSITAAVADVDATWKLRCLQMEKRQTVLWEHKLNYLNTKRSESTFVPNVLRLPKEHRFDVEYIYRFV